MNKHYLMWFFKSFSTWILSLFFVLFVSNTVVANSYKSILQETQQERLTIKQELSVQELFDFISSKTNYDFFFNSSLKELNQKVNLNQVNATVSQLLDAAFVGIPLEYSIKGNDILIRAKSQTTTEQGEREVSGIIKDDTGMPLPEVTILIKNSTTGTVTDFYGRFSIKVKSTDVLEFSYLGFKKHQVTVGNKTYFEIDLESDNNQLEEIIIAGVASGTSRKKLSVSVAKIDSKELEKVPQSSVASSLTGKIAGVSVTSFSGSPGSSPQIVLRGSTNLTGNNSPMILMDGVIMQGSLADINVMDIESMEIVKGAAASSLYGSKAANGVIVITSKRGKKLKEGKTSIVLRSETGFQQVAKYLDLSQSHDYMLAPDWLDADTYTKYYFVDYPDDYVTGWDPRISGNRVEKADHYQDMPYRETRDLQKEMFTDGLYTSNYIGVGHKAENSNLFLSFENNENEGVVIETGGYTRNSLRANLDISLTDDIKIIASNNYIKTSNDFMGGGEAGFFEVLMTEPDVDLFRDNVDGQPYNYYPNQWNTQFSNPLYDLAKKESDSNKSRFLGSYNLEWDFADWISFDGSYAFETQSYRSQNYTPKGTIINLIPNLMDPNDPDSINPIDPIEPQYSDGSLSKYNSTIFNQSFRATVNFKKTWGELDFNSKLSYLNEKNHFESVTTRGTNFSLPDLPSLNYFTQENISASDFTSDINSENYFAIASLVFKDRYILDGLFRVDGSSLFGENERWHNYYRVSAAYRISKDITIPGVQELKIRTAYGTSGLRPGFSSQYETFNVNNGTFSKSTLGNKDLKPSRSNELEVGLDVSFLNRFSFDVAYSNAIVTDQYLLAPLPVHLGGYPNQWVNAGELETNTVEATFNAKIMSKENISWSATLTFDRTRTEITKLDIPSYSTGPRNAFRIAEGEQYGTMYGVDFVRTLNQMEQQLPVGDDINSYSVNRDGVVVRTADIGTINEKPFVVLDENGAEKSMNIGDVNPDFRIGLNTTFSWKGLSAYMLWQWKQGGDLYNGTAQYLMRDNRHAMVDQIHTKPEDKKTVDYYQALYDAQALNGFWVEDASYGKLVEASIYYTLDFEALGLTSKFLEYIRFGVLGKNLATITNYSGYDPQAGSDGFLFDDFGYPNFRSYTFSVEFKF